MNARTKKLTTVAMLCAFAYAVMVVGRIPMILFLKYDPKDIIITIGGFIYGPFVAFVISIIVSIIELFTVSSTGFIGFLMNALASCGFACTAAAIYKHKRTMIGAVVGLMVGTVVMTIIMLLWNYLLTPLYMQTPRADIVAMLVPIFLPFNLVKGGINTALILLLYKPLVSALRKAGLLEIKEEENSKGRVKFGILAVASILLITCVLIVLAWQGVL